MSKATVLELDPGGHQIIRGIHNCAYSQLQTCFQGEGKESSATP